MKKPKFIEDETRKQYKQDYQSLLKIVNPPKISEQERLKILSELRKEKGV